MNWNLKVIYDYWVRIGEDICEILYIEDEDKYIMRIWLIMNFIRVIGK